MLIIKQLKEITETGILPDGDHINLPTQMWLEENILELCKVIENKTKLDKKQKNENK